MKKVILVVVLCLVALTLCSCNKQIFDITYNYDYAILQLPDGSTVEGEVSSWMDYEGDQLQIVINKVSYLVHSSNAVLIDK